MLTYKLNPELKIIVSPVVLVCPGNERMRFANGEQAAAATFDRRLLIDTISAEGGTVVLTLKEQEPTNLNWAGEESVSFF